MYINYIVVQKAIFAKFVCLRLIEKRLYCKCIEEKVYKTHTHLSTQAGSAEKPVGVSNKKNQIIKNYLFKIWLITRIHSFVLFSAYVHVINIVKLFGLM